MPYGAPMNATRAVSSSASLLLDDGTLTIKISEGDNILMKEITRLQNALR